MTRILKGFGLFAASILLCSFSSGEEISFAHWYCTSRYFVQCRCVYAVWWAHNPKAVGLNPTPATNEKDEAQLLKLCLCVSSNLVCLQEAQELSIITQAFREEAIPIQDM